MTVTADTVTITAGSPASPTPAPSPLPVDLTAAIAAAADFAAQAAASAASVPGSSDLGHALMTAASAGAAKGILGISAADVAAGAFPDRANYSMSGSYTFTPYDTTVASVAARITKTLAGSSSADSHYVGVASNDSVVAIGPTYSPLVIRIDDSADLGLGPTAYTVADANGILYAWRTTSALVLEHNINGNANTTGARETLATRTYFNAPTGPNNNSRNYVGQQASVIVRSPDTVPGVGVLGTAGSYSGAFFAYNPYVIAKAGATNLLEIAGAEVNVGLQTGSSAKYRFGWSVVSFQQNQGDSIDAAFEVGGSQDLAKWRTALAISDASVHGGAGLSTDGQIIWVSGPVSCAWAFDLLNLTTSGGLLRSKNVLLTDGQLSVSMNATPLASQLPAGSNAGAVAHLVGADGAVARVRAVGYGDRSQLSFFRANGTAAAPTSVVANDILGLINGAGYDSISGNFSGRVNQQFLAAENWTATAQGTFIAWFTTTKTTLSLVERVRLDDAGNLLIGVTSGTEKLTVAGNAVPSADNTYTCGKSGGRWSAIWSANGTIQTSDERDKDIVSRFGSAQAAAIVDAIEPIKFRWHVGGHDEHREIVPDGEDEDGQPKFREEVTYTEKPGVRVHAGFIAQEVKSAMDANGGDFGAWGLEDAHDPASKQFLRPDQLIPVLWEALRATRQELASLKAQIAP
jgi:hypothetical protein